MKLMGIYGLEKLDCGCEIKHYAGGKVIRIACKNHKNEEFYECPTCNIRLSKNKLKKHRWEHAV